MAYRPTSCAQIYFQLSSHSFQLHFPRLVFPTWISKLRKKVPEVRFCLKDLCHKAHWTESRCEQAFWWTNGTKGLLPTSNVTLALHVPTAQTPLSGKQGSLLKTTRISCCIILDRFTRWQSKCWVPLLTVPALHHPHPLPSSQPSAGSVSYTPQV